ncbi:ATP synthase F1 subunit gamma [Candidatus Woesebacteria bacterium]|jgi:F-type H+-transporting ATPase subunit gamma|nr:ATP synthase F1 subunit gamma [Candidatus Woesebacteria bacterium]
MANIRLIKGRIKTSKNIAQITKAMELVAAAKMKKAQVAALAGKLYAGKIYEMVMRLSRRTDYRSHPLLMTPAPTGKRLMLLISTNKGLCGGLNTNLFRYVLQQYPDIKSHDVITLGKKGADFITRLGKTVKADFSDSVIWENTVPAIVDVLTREFISGQYDGVDVVSNEFLSVVRQNPRKKALLPLSLEPQAVDASEEKAYDFVIEPSVAEVFDALLPHYIENQIRDAVLQARASEYSAQMIAMHNATDNAKNLQQELTLVYNKARQEKITYEITDMVTARLAVEI